MKIFDQIKRVAFLGTAHVYFKGIPRHQVYPFLYQGYWVISTDFSEIRPFMRIVDPITIRVSLVASRTIRDGASKGGGNDKQEFHYEIISDTLFIVPV